MAKVAELKQTYEELCEEFDSKYGHLDFVEMNEEATRLYIKLLEAKLDYMEVAVDEFSFNRSHKPVLNHKIMRAKAHIENRKFFNARRITA